MMKVGLKQGDGMAEALKALSLWAFFCVVSAVIPTGAMACSFFRVEWLLGVDLNLRVSYAPNGSFRGGGEGDGLKGGPIKDLGGKKVYQVLSSRAPCSLTEAVLVTDCDTATSIVLEKWPKAESTSANADSASTEIVIFQGTNLADALLPPNGILGNVSHLTLPEIVEHAVELGAIKDSFTLEQNAKEKPRDQFKPFYGCYAFYKGTPGALRWREGA